MNLRIGQGFDIHRFGGTGRLMIGGVDIPYESGVVAHSDGDVLLHALCDALLGACAKTDIGTLFPPSDPRYADYDSSLMIAAVCQMLHLEAWRVVNVDSTILTERPKIGPHREAIQARVAECLQIPTACVSIKAKTMEGLGPIGAGDAIAAQCVVLLAGE